MEDNQGAAAMEDSVTPGPMRLLIVEAFAGTHPVGRVVKDIDSFGPNGAIKVAAYLCMESQSESKCSGASSSSEAMQAKLPPCEELGLQPDCCLKCHGQQGGDVGSPEVQRKVLNFVREHLEKGTIDAVIVFGSPPCTEYSNAKVAHDAKTRVETAAAQEYIKAIEAHAKARLAATQALQNLERSNLEATSTSQLLQQLETAEHAVFELHEKDTAAAGEAAAMAAWEKAASEAFVQATRDYATILEADATVKRFLNMYKRIEAEFKVYCEASQGVACYLVMENPYSTAERALCNRPFMKPHLINLPSKPHADKIEHNPAEGAWLHSYYQDWCTYNDDNQKHPMKPTIVFSNLPNLKDVSCAHPRGAHLQVQNQSGAGERAKWPLPFVKKMLEAVVEVVKPELLPQAKLVLAQPVAQSAETPAGRKRKAPAEAVPAGLTTPAVAAGGPATTEATTAADKAAQSRDIPAGRKRRAPPEAVPFNLAPAEAAGDGPATTGATTAGTTSAAPAAPGATVAPQVVPIEEQPAADTVNPLASLSIEELLNLVADLGGELATEVQLKQATAAVAELSKRQDSQWQQLQLANSEPDFMPDLSGGLAKLLGIAGSLRKQNASVVIKMLAKRKSVAVVDNLLASQQNIVGLLVGLLMPSEPLMVIKQAAAALAALAACSQNAQTVVGNTGALAANLKHLLQHVVANPKLLKIATAAADTITALTDNHHRENINRFKQIGVPELLQQLYARPLPESSTTAPAQLKSAKAAKTAARDALNSLGVQPVEPPTAGPEPLEQQGA